jgi:drug/metabolite transporter (DMT)-like permease
MKFAPVFFVLLWSTGFVGAKYGLPYADPFIFLGIRVFIAAALLYAFALFSKAKIRLTKSELKLSAMVGSTLHFAYLGGVFFGISRGVPAGIAATITSLQPIVVSILGVRVLKESVTKRQLAGLLFGFLGVLIVLSPAFKSTSTMTAIGILSVFVALFGSTTATLVQKRAGGSVPMISGTAFQYVIAGALFMSAATVTQGFHVTWSGKFVFALTWLVLALSVGAVLLLLSLLKRGSASEVSSLFYLVPPATAIEAFFLFDEKLTALDFFGISLTALGVYLVIKKKQVK